MIVPYQFFSKFHFIQYIRYGPHQANVECLAHHKDDKTLYISSKLKSKLNLSKNKTLAVTINDNQCTLLLTLGVLTAGFNSDSEVLGPRTQIFKSLSEAGEKLGFKTIFFGYQHISYRRREIYAYYLDKGQFSQDFFTIPTVIYNRLPNRKIEHHPEVIQAKKWLNMNSTLFNQGFFNKWEIYEHLMKNLQCSYLLPETTLHPSKQKIINLLAKHPLYIKPIHGSRGTGIVRCKKIATGEIECHYYYKDKSQVNRYTKIESFLDQHFPNGLKGYVAQKEIPLMKKGNSAIDFRVHSNKNHRNSWEVSLICAKFAGKGSLTTHVQRGGSIHTVNELFSEVQTKRIYNRLTTTAILLSTQIEKDMPHLIGEIGFDFGIDEEGKVWLFEANSKPGFSIFNHPVINQDAINILSYPFMYAFYLHNLKMNKD
ncbi:YheC/YheD family endospore coat-associated protein [Aquibacillus saliphilus]|uniref:YheC/YheD family endospore coat-associated protein n=1 Tax=Aquibacillus saliphilus TaxID=1909422 RepID=UPI001CF06421|nr:YheC/YheD family protein [Aquibacillus saliphilus]